MGYNHIYQGKYTEIPCFHLNFTGYPDRVKWKSQPSICRIGKLFINIYRFSVLWNCQWTSLLNSSSIFELYFHQFIVIVMTSWNSIFIKKNWYSRRQNRNHFSCIGLFFGSESPYNPTSVVSNMSAPVLWTNRVPSQMSRLIVITRFWTAGQLYRNFEKICVQWGFIWYERSTSLPSWLGDPWAAGI